MPLAAIDLYGNRLPSWVAHSLMLKTTQTCNGACMYVTGLQMSQLHIAKTRGDVADDGLTNTTHGVHGRDITATRALLVHRRPCHRFRCSHGDGAYAVDYSATYLSCRGEALTHDAASLRALARASAADTHCALPYWLSARDVAFVRRLLMNVFCLLPQQRSVDALARDLADDIVSPCVQTLDHAARTVACRVLPVTRLYGRPLTSAQCRMLHSAFRQFAPMNVHTRRRYTRAIADELRCECVHSKCWCTVWGTEDDFRACHVAPLRGALGVDVFDDLGNPLFLISAMCTTDPARALAHAYVGCDIVYKAEQ